MAGQTIGSSEMVELSDLLSNNLLICVQALAMLFFFLQTARWPDCHDDHRGAGEVLLDQHENPRAPQIREVKN